MQKMNFEIDFDLPITPIYYLTSYNKFDKFCLINTTFPYKTV